MIDFSFEQLRRDATNSMQVRKLSVPPISIEIKGRGDKMTYEQFKKTLWRKKELVLVFVRIKGVGSKTANEIVTYLLSLPKDKRAHIASLIQKGVD